MPVEHKRGRGPETLFPTIAQTIAQAICLEEMLHTLVLLWRSTSPREATRTRTRERVSRRGDQPDRRGARRASGHHSGRLPTATVHLMRCAERLPTTGVQWAAILLPTHLVRSHLARLILDGDAVRRSVTTPKPRRLPLNAIDSIAVLQWVDISTPLLTLCRRWPDDRDPQPLQEARAVIEGPDSGRGQLRRYQYRAHFDDGNATLARTMSGREDQPDAMGIATVGTRRRPRHSAYAAMPPPPSLTMIA